MPGALAAPFADKDALKTAIRNCLGANMTGWKCCSTDPNCADPSSARCGAAGCDDMPLWDTSLVTNMANVFATCNAESWCEGNVLNSTSFNENITRWDTSKVWNMGSMFYGAAAFNQPIGSWDTSKVTDMRYLFYLAPAFYQDITGWSSAALTDSYSINMFQDATAWLDRVKRRDESGNLGGPTSAWVHKPCLADERVQAGWCVPCGQDHLNAAGDDPAAGIDTECNKTSCCQAKMIRFGFIPKRE